MSDHISGLGINRAIGPSKETKLVPMRDLIPSTLGNPEGISFDDWQKRAKRVADEVPTHSLSGKVVKALNDGLQAPTGLSAASSALATTLIAFFSNSKKP